MNFEDYETLPTSNVVTHMTAGAIAGVMEHCVMYPLDSVKVMPVEEPGYANVLQLIDSGECHRRCRLLIRNMSGDLTSLLESETAHIPICGRLT